MGPAPGGRFGTRTSLRLNPERADEVVTVPVPVVAVDAERAHPAPDVEGHPALARQPLQGRHRFDLNHSQQPRPRAVVPQLHPDAHDSSNRSSRVVASMNPSTYLAGTSRLRLTDSTTLARANPGSSRTSWASLLASWSTVTAAAPQPAGPSPREEPPGRRPRGAPAWPGCGAPRARGTGPGPRSRRAGDPPRARSPPAPGSRAARSRPHLPQVQGRHRLTLDHAGVLVDHLVPRAEVVHLGQPSEVRRQQVQLTDHRGRPRQPQNHPHREPPSRSTRSPSA